MTTKSIGSIPKFPKAGWLGVKVKNWTAPAVAKIKAKQQAKGAKRAA